MVRDPNDGTGWLREFRLGGWFVWDLVVDGLETRVPWGVVLVAADNHELPPVCRQAAEYMLVAVLMAGPPYGEPLQLVFPS